MPKVIINDVSCDAQVGERLVDVARRNAAHIGFVCEGLLFFFYQANAVRILKGGENVSPPSELEQNWFSPELLEAGHRMACEVIIQGQGTVEVLSYAEELRRQTMGVFSPPEGSSSGENAGMLLRNMGNIFWGQISRFPFNVAGAIPVFARRVQQRDINIICLPNIGNILRDTGRVVNSMTGGAKQLEDQQTTAPAKGK